MPNQITPFLEFSEKIIIIVIIIISIIINIISSSSIVNNVYFSVINNTYSKRILEINFLLKNKVRSKPVISDKHGKCLLGD